MKTLPSAPKTIYHCIVCICIYTVSSYYSNSQERNATSVLLRGEADFWPVQPPLPKVTGKAELMWAARPAALKCSQDNSGTWTPHQDGSPPSQGPKPRGCPTYLGLHKCSEGTSCSSSWWSACWRATLRMWIGSSRRPWDRKPRGVAKKNQVVCPQPAPPWLAPCSHPHLAVVLRVQGILGLAEKGCPGHVGKAGDDLIKVPRGAGQRGRAEGPLPHEVVGQTRTLPLPNHHTASASCLCRAPVVPD